MKRLSFLAFFAIGFFTLNAQKAHEVGTVIILMDGGGSAQGAGGTSGTSAGGSGYEPSEQDMNLETTQPYHQYVHKSKSGKKYKVTNHKQGDEYVIKATETKNSPNYAGLSFTFKVPKSMEEAIKLAQTNPGNNYYTHCEEQITAKEQEWAVQGKLNIEGGTPLIKGGAGTSVNKSWGNNHATKNSGCVTIQLNEQ